MTALLEIRDVAVRFGGVRALDGVTFALQAGELLGLIGPNGAGKTTALRAITGTVRPDRGAVVLDGLELTRLPVHRRVRAGLGMSQQLVRPFRAMTAIENVMLAAGTAKTHAPFGALLKRDRGPEREKALAHLETVGIAEAAESAPDSLPLGTLKRLEMARALATRPIRPSSSPTCSAKVTPASARTPPKLTATSRTSKSAVMARPSRLRRYGSRWRACATTGPARPGRRG